MAKKVKEIKEVEEIKEVATVKGSKIKCIVAVGKGELFGTQNIKDGSILNLPMATFKELLAKKYVIAK